MCVLLYLSRSSIISLSFLPTEKKCRETSETSAMQRAAIGCVGHLNCKLHFLRSTRGITQRLSYSVLVLRDHFESAPVITSYAVIRDNAAHSVSHSFLKTTRILRFPFLWKFRRDEQTASRNIFGVASPSQGQRRIHYPSTFRIHEIAKKKEINLPHYAVCINEVSFTFVELPQLHV